MHKKVRIFVVVLFFPLQAIPFFFPFLFRLWSTRRWSQQRWSVSSGSVQSACWSADSSTLLYTTNNECQIFCIKFQPDMAASAGDADDEDCLSTGVAVPVMDLTKVTFTDDMTGREIT